MPTRHRPRSTPLFVALLTLILMPGLACRGANPETTEDPEASSGSELEVGPSACEGQPLVADTRFELPEVEDPLLCTELIIPEPVPLPTTASCAELPREERLGCVAEVRGRARAARPLAEGLAAATANHWPEAIAKLEAAALLTNAPDVLAEVGRARFLANRWCDQTQDPMDLDSGDPDAELSPVAELCTRRASLHQAASELSAAVEAAPSRELLALWELHHAEVALALGETGEALQSARVSVCMHDEPAARELFGSLLWREANRVGLSDPADALRLYRESLAVAPNPERQMHADAVAAAFEGVFQLEAASPVSPRESYTDMDALCTGLVLANMNEPVEPEELPEDLCEAGEWVEVSVARGDDFEVQFHVTTLTVGNPEMYDGRVATVYLVARTRRGVNVLLQLGTEHGDSRMHSSFAGSIDIANLSDIPDAPLVVTWDAGEAEAYGCNWHARASTQLALCALLEGTPRCFAGADLGPTEFTSDSMLPTVQESLGNCDDADYAESVQPDPSEFRSRYSVEVTAQELVATRPDGAMVCLPLRETLSPLRQPAAGR